MSKKLIDKALRAPRVEIKLAEGNALPKKIQVIRTGTFHHPEYGKMEITKQHLADFVRNFNEKTRGIDISLDLAHESDKEAAAWLTKLELADDGNSLFAEIDWTELGSKKVQGKEYRYVSADFHLNYKDAETLKFHGPTLLGAGLTNRPFIKNMEPVIQLSEFIGGNQMDLAQAMAKIAELEQQLKAAQAGAQSPEQMADMQKKMQGLQAQCAELQKEVDANKAKEVEAEKAAKLAEKKGRFDKLLADKKAVEAQREAFMADDMAKYAELAMDPKSIKFSESGNGGNGSGDAEDADAVQDQVLKLAETMVKEKKAATLGDAISEILSSTEHKKLAEQYNSIQFSMKE